MGKVGGPNQWKQPLRGVGGFWRWAEPAVGPHQWETLLGGSHQWEMPLGKVGGPK